MSKDLEAVNHILNSFFEVLYDMELQKPELFNDSNFSKWSMLAGFNYLCQMAHIHNMDLEFLQLNLKAVWDAMQRNNSNTIVN
jgi:hypothetical protein